MMSRQELLLDAAASLARTPLAFYVLGNLIYTNELQCHFGEPIFFRGCFGAIISALPRSLHDKVDCSTPCTNPRELNEVRRLSLLIE